MVSRGVTQCEWCGPAIGCAAERRTNVQDNFGAFASRSSTSPWHASGAHQGRPPVWGLDVALPERGALAAEGRDAEGGSPGLLGRV